MSTRISEMTDVDADGLNTGLGDSCKGSLVSKSRRPICTVLILLTMIAMGFFLCNVERTNATPSSAALSSNQQQEEIYVPGGEFGRGCAIDHHNGKCDEDARPITLTYVDPFYIHKTEVTNAQYRECVTANVCLPPLSSASATRAHYYDDPGYNDYPVIHIDWERADTYCRWRGMRLPTEAEWEKAARGADLRWYPWGNEHPTCERTNFSNLVFTWPGEFYMNVPCVGDTVAVGLYPHNASPYGVLDMVGNVREWVGDYYKRIYYPSASFYNPQGPSDGGDKGEHLVRGGSWADHELEGNNVWVRIDEANIYQTERIGFRCARTAQLQPTPTPVPPSPTPTPLPSDTVLIGGEGGLVWISYPGHLTMVHVPAGQATSGLTLTVSYTQPHSFGDLVPMDHFFTISGTELTEPATVLLGFRGSGGLIEGTMNLFHLQGDRWVTDAITVTEQSGGHLLGQITQLGTYGILGETLRAYLPLVIRH